jgi:SP family arabinose:H+ symporter-like MFS transporter
MHLTETSDTVTAAARSDEGSLAYASLVAAVAAISGLLFGFDTAVINGALLLLRQDFSLTDFQTELAASALLAGCVAGAAAAGAISDRFGRRKSLVLSALLFAASSLGCALARGLTGFSMARIAGGLAIGLASTLTPVYIAELAPPQLRGRLVSLNQLAIVLGILAAFLTNWGLSTMGSSSWRWMFAAGAVPSAALFAGLQFIPESPRWLVARGLVDRGRAVLERVAGRTGAAAQLAEIEAEALADRGLSLRELLSTSLRRRLAIAIALAALQQISGINTVLYYGSVMFHERFRGESFTTAIGANVLLGVVNLLCTVVAMLYIDRWGRRALLLAASGGMSVCLTVLALTFGSPAMVPAIVFASVLLYVGFFAIGLGPGVWVYMAEIFPTTIRGRAMSVATTALWAACFVVTLTFLSIVRAAGVAGAFAIYAALCLITFAFVWKWVPETRGKSLEQIQRMWDR